MHAGHPASSRSHAAGPAACPAGVRLPTAPGRPLDEAAYGRLVVQSIADPASTFASIDPALFGRIVSEKVPAGAGPTQGVPGSTPAITPKGGT